MSQLLPIQTIMIHVDQMILSEPSIIFIWKYQDMMEWISAGYWLEKWLVLIYFGIEVGQL
jgi:hypothetical protein